MRGSKILRWIDTVVGSLLVSVLRKQRGWRPAARHPETQIAKILIIKLAALGDTLLLVPTLRLLRERHPAARIDFLGTAINEELIALFPSYVDRFVKFDPRKGAWNLRYLFSIIKILRSEHYDIVFDFEQWSFATALLSYASGAPERVGFELPGKNRHLLATTFYRRRPDVHELDNFLGLAGAAGLSGDSRDLELPVGDDMVKRAKIRLRQAGWNGADPVVVVHPGCGSHGFPREWPVHNYIDLCQRLRQHQKIYYVISGSASEHKLMDDLGGALVENVLVWDETSLGMLLGLLSIAAVVVSGNNGVMHLAAALERPQIALHGPTDSRKWGPLNDHAVVIRSNCPGCPCLDLGFEFHRIDGFCMAQISVDEVYEAAVKLLPIHKS